MKSRSFWYLGALIGVLFIVVPLISAVVTATDAFGNDLDERVNRIDFVWAAVGFVIAAFSFYRTRRLE